MDVRGLRYILAAFAIFMILLVVAGKQDSEDKNKRYDRIQRCIDQTKEIERCKEIFK